MGGTGMSGRDEDNGVKAGRVAIQTKHTWIAVVASWQSF